MLGDILHMSGRLAEAETSFQEALRLHRELGSVRDEATTLRGLSELRRNLGDACAAEELAADAAAKLRRVKDGVELGLALCALGHAALASGRPASGPLAEAEGLAEALGMGDASSVRKAIARLRRAAARAAESGSEALWRGQCREDVRPEVLGEGDPEHRGTLP